jgi:antitoxin VapB
MQTAKLFMIGRRQAVRLPEGFRFEGKRVFIQRIGKSVILLPCEQTWDAVDEALDSFERGFRLTREQPKPDERETLLP